MRRKKLILFGVLVFFIGLLSAIIIDEFDTYGASGNITYTGDANATMNVTFNATANITSAVLNLTGYEWNENKNLSSAVYLHGINVYSLETSLTGIFFNPDGDKMYTTGSGGDSIDEYDLSDEWNVSSAVYLHELDISGEQHISGGIFFNI